MGLDLQVDLNYNIEQLFYFVKRQFLADVYVA
jgi:hypothetical protein